MKHNYFTEDFLKEAILLTLNSAITVSADTRYPK